MLGKYFLLGLIVFAYGVGCGSPGSTVITTGAGGAGGEAGAGGAAGAGGTAGAGGAAGAGGTAGTGGAGGGAGGSGGGGTIVIVQATDMQISPSEDVPTLTWTTPPTQGNAIIVGITCFSDVDNCTIPMGGVTDNHGNTYQQVIEGDTIVSQPTHGSRGYIFLAQNVTVQGGAFTISVDPNGTVPPATQSLAWGALEVSGLASNSVDQTGLFPNTGGMITSTTVMTNGATAQGNELAVAVHTMRSNDADVSYMHDPAWTQHHVNADGQAVISAHSMVSRILTQSGVVSHTWMHDEPTRGVAAVIATFRGGQ